MTCCRRSLSALAASSRSRARRVGLQQLVGLLESQPQRGERGAQLVRGVAGERPLLVDEPLGALGHPVERVGEVADLGRPAGGLRPGRQVAAGEPLRRAPQRRGAGRVTLADTTRATIAAISTVIGGDDAERPHAIVDAIGDDPRPGR